MSTLCLCGYYTQTFTLIFSDIDECFENTHSCVNDANCTNTDGSFICQCGFGFVGDGRSTGTGCNGNKIDFLRVKVDEHIMWQDVRKGGTTRALSFIPAFGAL